MTVSTAMLVFAGCILGITGIVFYKTIITGEWRNRVPDEQAHWRGWIFYYNPNDARLFLPKRTGLGWTINFAQPLAIALLVLLILAIVMFGIMMDARPAV